MQKLRITVTHVLEFTPDPDHYKPGATIEEIAAKERDIYGDDPGCILGFVDTNTTSKVEIL